MKRIIILTAFILLLLSAGCDRRRFYPTIEEAIRSEYPTESYEDVIIIRDHFIFCVPEINTIVHGGISEKGEYSISANYPTKVGFWDVAIRQSDVKARIFCNIFDEYVLLNVNMETPESDERRMRLYDSQEKDFVLCGGQGGRFFIDYSHEAIEDSLMMFAQTEGGTYAFADGKILKKVIQLTQESEEFLPYLNHLDESLGTYPAD